MVESVKCGRKKTERRKEAEFFFASAFAVLYASSFSASVCCSLEVEINWCSTYNQVFHRNGYVFMYTMQYHMHSKCAL